MADREEESIRELQVEKALEEVVNVEELETMGKRSLEEVANKEGSKTSRRMVEVMKVVVVTATA